MNRIVLCLDKGKVRITGDYRPLSRKPAAPDFPLIVAIHGGTYTSKYFDVDNYSLLARASELGIPIFAVNRPCYAGSGSLSAEQASIRNSAEVVNEALHQLWDEHQGDARGIVVIGHSIGGAATVLLAGMQKEWPLLGIAVSGVGMRPVVFEQWQAMTQTPWVNFPPPMKDSAMFGPDFTYAPGVPELCHGADHLMPARELLDILFEWPRLVHEAAPLVCVPVHYRQPEFDHLWHVSEEEVQSFKACFTQAPVVDAALFGSSGHCIDFHRLGCAFQLQQLAFALGCCRPG